MTGENGYRSMGFPAKTLVSMVGLLWFIAAVVACDQLEIEAGQGERQMPEKSIEEVLKENTDSLMSLPGVVETAQGECSGQPCIRVFVVKKTPDLLKEIPSELEGYPVAVDETGEIQALDPG